MFNDNNITNIIILYKHNDIIQGLYKHNSIMCIISAENRRERSGVSLWCPARATAT